MTQALQATNVKIITKNPKTGEEHMTHVPVRSETFLPASNKVIKEKG